MKEENQNSYTIQSDEAIGQVQIADEVVAIIAGLAATEVEGVASMAGNLSLIHILPAFLFRDFLF